MREYEMTVLYDLAVAEAGGAEAAPELVTTAVESRGGHILRIDHWGRRRLAYPIGKAVDADYVVSRFEAEAPLLAALEEGFRIDERVYRFLVVRADELPKPPEPRAPRRTPEEVAAANAAAAAPAPVTAPAPAATPASAETPEPAVAAAAEPAVAAAPEEPTATPEATEAPAVAAPAPEPEAPAETAAAADAS